MAKNTDTKYNINFETLKKKLSGKQIPSNILLFVPEKILFEEILDIAGKSFIGKEYSAKTHLKLYYSDDKNIEDVINDCSNQ